MNLPRLSTAHAYSQLRYAYDVHTKTLWSFMRPAPRPCFTAEMLDEIASSELLLERHDGWIDHRGVAHRVEYLVTASDIPGVYNLGGDLNAFADAIERGDRALLERYGHTCVACIARRGAGFGCGITTFALIEGRALGGGFEAALACDVLVADEAATFSFPELLFNLSPAWAR